MQKTRFEMQKNSILKAKNSILKAKNSIFRHFTWVDSSAFAPKKKACKELRAYFSFGHIAQTLVLGLQKFNSSIKSYLLWLPKYHGMVNNWQNDNRKFQSKSAALLQSIKHMLIKVVYCDEKDLDFRRQTPKEGKHCIFYIIITHLLHTWTEVRLNPTWV